MVWIALMSMMAACLAQHLGLAEAVASVIHKVAKCPKCMTFWTTLAVLISLGCEPFTASALSILMSYLSHYFGLVLMVLNKVYDWLWQKGSN